MAKVATRRRERRRIFNLVFTPRFAWMASKETEQFTSRPETMIEGAGTTLKAAADILRNYGAVPDSMLPFKVNTAMYSGNENTFYATAATRHDGTAPDRA